MNWKDFGFSDFLTKTLLKSPPPPSEQQIASGSIKTQHLYGGAVTNEKINISSRSYQAIVSTTIGDGNYRDIQQAINYVHNEIGYGNIFVRSGTYTPDADVILYSNIELEGESKENTIIDFEGGAFELQIKGTRNGAPTGTISIAQNSKTVTGVTTAFLSEVSEGNYLYFNNVAYKVGSVTNNTTLTLINTYRGTAVSGLATWNIWDAIEGVRVSKIQVYDNSVGNNGVAMYAAVNCEIESIITREAGTDGVDCSWCFNCRVKSCTSSDNGYAGFDFGAFKAGMIQDLSAFGNTWHGINLSGVGSLQATIVGCEAYHNQSRGFNLNSCHSYSILGCSSYENQDDGFYFISSDYIKIQACEIRDNGGWGLDISNAACDRNTITGNDIINNTSGNIQNNGMNTIDANNQKA